MAARRPQPWAVRRQSDDRLRARFFLDLVTLMRLRKTFWTEYKALSGEEKTGLVTAGVTGRLAFLHQQMGFVWDETHWEIWYRQTEHAETVIQEMEAGTLPISPFLIRVYGALFGIEDEFLRFGMEPEPAAGDREMWVPATTGASNRAR